MHRWSPNRQERGIVHVDVALGGDVRMKPMALKGAVTIIREIFAR